MNKKGQGLSMNVIIIAAIALLVLVILSVLVMKASGKIPDEDPNAEPVEVTQIDPGNGIYLYRKLKQ